MKKTLTVKSSNPSASEKVFGSKSVMKQLTAVLLMLFSFITSGLNAQTGGILNKDNVDYSKNFPPGMTTEELNKIVNLPKGAQDKFRGPEVTDQNGGPDAYGYKWIDSDDPGGPVYNWVEISGVGTAVSSWTNGQDDGYTAVALPFAFPYYGTSYSNLKICTNGWVSFDVASATAVYNNIPIPDASEPNNAIFPFWDDLDLNFSSGNVYYYNDAANNRFIIQYNNVPHYSGGSEGPGPYTFEVILKRDGGILFQYKSVLDPLTSNTIGIENSAGTDGLQMVYNNTYVKNNFAVIISVAPPIITSISPLSGNVGSTVIINGSGFNSTPAMNTVYFGSVKANVIASAYSYIGVTVPAGSNYQNISVTNLAFNLTGYSNLPFNITFPGGCKPDLADGIGYNNAGFGIEKIRTVDFDGDGNSDILVTNGIGASVGVSRVTTTSGVINLAARTDYAIGGQPGSICTGDIDGDGKSDIIATKRNSTVLSVFRNTSTVGSISFAARVDFTVGTDPYSVSIGDLDGDGRPDLATANTGFAGSNNISVLRNVSTPGVISFDPKIDLASGLGPIAICIGDINGDGKNDLAVAANNTNVSIYRNTSSVSLLSFAAPVNFTGGLVMRDMLIGDIDGDGKPDLITDNYNPGNISVLRNTSSSGIVSFASKVDFNAGGFGNQSLAIGDIDGDTKPDLAIAYDNKTIVSICRNISSAGVVNFENKIDFSPPSTSNSYCAAIGDLNLDGKPELLSGNYSGVKLTIFKNNAIAAALQTSIAGNGNPVVNGSVTPGLTNHTDFGYTALNTPVVRTFTMQNSSTDSLKINSISATGGDSSLFTAGSISPAGKIAPGTSKTFTVTFNTPSFGTKNAIVKLSSEIMTGTLCNTIQNYTFAVKGEAGTPPVISASLDTIVSTLLVGSNTETKNFSIGNSGTASLSWSLAENHPLSRPTASSVINHNFTDKEINKIINNPKGSRDEFKGSEVTDRSGGPDSFGYKWIDSDSAGGPLFKWTDIAGTGTAVSSFTNGNDDGYTIVGLPFSFPYYGVSYPKLKICTNGWVSFDTASTDAAFNNSPIPDSNEPNSIIAPFWDDLDLRSSGNVYYLNDVSNNRFLVQFNNVPHYNSGSGLGPYTFQVILHSNGSIYFQYLNMGSPLNSNTVGIENGAGNDGLQVVYNNTYIHNNLAVQILSPGYNWVSEDPVNGLIAGIGSQNVNLLFNSSSLPVGIYTGNLKISSNDLTNPVKNVALKLNVVSSVPALIKLAIEGFYNAGSDQLNISDTVKIYLRNSSSPYNIVDSAKSVINALTMTGSFLFSNAPSGNYYLQARGRNCIETWSGAAVSYTTGSVMNYDFTNLITKAFGSNMTQVNTSPVRFAVFSGDVNQDGTIDAGDLSQVENDAANSLSGYVPADATGDDFVDAGDLSIVENNVALGVSAITP